MSYDIRQVDWAKYLDREQSLLMFVMISHAYGEPMCEATGFGFTHELESYKGTTGTLYKSQKEMTAASEFFAQCIKDKNVLLAELAKTAKANNLEIDKLLEQFIQGQGSVTKDNFSEIYNLTVKTILYDTLIPYRVLASVNDELESKGELSENFLWTKKLFEPFRVDTRYPKIASVIFPHIYKLVAEGSDISDPSTISYAVPQELFDFFEKDKVLSQAKLEERKNGCVFWKNLDTGAIDFSFDSSLLQELGLTEKYESKTTLTGNPAYKGKVIGRVKVINSPSDIEKVEQGDIVVSFNTSPSLMPALLLCSAIVTDEGGIMCHAAIIARELKKPCIIGAKVATKVLKDGDLVEVDAEKGIVRLVEAQLVGWGGEGVENRAV